MKRLMVYCLVFAMILAPVLGTVAKERVARLDHDDLLAYLGNMQIEARLDADVTGDGRVDVVYVASSAHQRVLGVIGGGPYTAQIGRRSIAGGTLDVSPQVPVTLSFKNGVLSVEDLAGTEAVTVSRYQYRYQKSSNRMRLVALACEQYSPTLSHGSRRLSWNLDKGVHIVEEGKVVTLDTGEDVYVYESETRTSRKSAAVYMEDAPIPNDLLVTGGIGQAGIANDALKQGLESP